MKIFLFLLCSSLACLGSARLAMLTPDSPIIVPTRPSSRTPFPEDIAPIVTTGGSQDSVLSLTSDEELLCNAAIEYINQRKISDSIDLAPYIKRVMTESKASPASPVLARTDLQRNNQNTSTIHDLVTKATQKALADQKAVMDTQISKTTASLIGTLVTSAVTVTTTLIVHYYGK